MPAARGWQRRQVDQRSACPWPDWQLARHTCKDALPLPTAGIKMRRFISSELMRHWYTQNYDLLPAVGRRIFYKSKSSFESTCTQELGLKPERNSDVDLVRGRYLGPSSLRVEGPRPVSLVRHCAI